MLIIYLLLSKAYRKDPKSVNPVTFAAKDVTLINLQPHRMAAHAKLSKKKILNIFCVRQAANLKSINDQLTLPPGGSFMHR